MVGEVSKRDEVGGFGLASGLDKPLLNVDSNRQKYLIVLAALLYFLINAASQGLVSSTAEWDNCQQLILSQELQWGYNSQPPLYTWIVISVFKITGPSLAALLVIKAFLLASFVAAIVLICHELEASNAQIVIAVLGLAFIPQFSWENQRNYTHSVLAIVIAALTLYQFIRISRLPSFRQYILFGVLLGLGLLSKYNYILFVFALMLSALTVPIYSRVIKSKEIILSIAIAALLFLPHAVWALSHHEQVTQSADKFDIQGGIHLAGIAHAMLALFSFLFLLMLAGVLVYRRGVRYSTERPESGRLLLTRTWVIVICLIFVLILVSGSQTVKDHWIQPLLFFSTILLALNSDPAHLKTRARIYNGVALVLLLVIAIIIPARVIFAGYSGKLTRLNIPYSDLSARIKSLVGDPDVIIADSDPLAGNMRLGFPSSQVVSPDTYHSTLSHCRHCVVVTSSPDRGNNKFGDWIKDEFGVDTIKYDKISFPYYYAPGREYSLYWAWLP
jgi:4-amino-4-deoxy-L-arabinose transferase-like glycosyltransferase